MTKPPIKKPIDLAADLEPEADKLPDLAFSADGDPVQPKPAPGKPTDKRAK